MPVHRIPEMNCLACGQKLNHVGDEQTPPNPGDWTICLYCRHPMVFMPDFTLRNLSIIEEEEAVKDPAFIEAMEFVIYYQKMTDKATRH